MPHTDDEDDLGPLCSPKLSTAVHSTIERLRSPGCCHQSTVEIAAIDLVRATLADMATDSERQDFLAELLEGVCIACGRILSSGEVCHCWNDE